MKSKLIKINEIEIELKKNSRARRLIISVKPFANPTVTIPHYISFRQGEEFAIEKMGWIETQLYNMRSRENDLLINPENFKTRNHSLELIPTNTENISIRLNKGIIKIKYPNWKKSASQEIQSAIRKGILKAYKEEAVEYLPKRLNDLSDKFNLPFKEVYIKNIRSRWGSCSASNNINLSVHLMRLPDHLIDYVILHELVHTKIKNHSKIFWNMLDSFSGNAKGLDKELKKFRIH